MTASNQWTPSAVLLIALVLSPVAAEAEKVKNVSGLSGVQDGDSKQMLSLSPEAMDQVGRRDLLSVLKSPGKLILDNSRNVEGVTFTTQPYEIGYPYVCRGDACDVISFEDVDITIIGTIANDRYGFTPTSIKSVRVDQVIELET